MRWHFVNRSSTHTVGVTQAAQTCCAGVSASCAACHRCMKPLQPTHTQHTAIQPTHKLLLTARAQARVQRLFRQLSSKAMVMSAQAAAHILHRSISR